MGPALARRAKRRRAAGLAGVAAVGAATWLASGDDSRSGAFSAASVQTAASKIEPQGAVCPLTFNPVSALARARIGGTLTPSADRPQGITAVTAEPGSPLARQQGSMIECDFTISSGGSGATTRLAVTVVDVRTGGAENLLAPRLQVDGHLSTAGLRAFYSTQTPAGTVRSTPGDGSAAMARPHVAGPGDVAIEFAVSVPGDDTKTSPLAGQPLQRLAQELLNTSSL